jgi:hypothetical protein
MAIRRTETMMLDMENDLDVGQRDDREDIMRFDDLPPESPMEAHNGGGSGGGEGTAAAEAPPRDAKRDLRNGWQVLAGSVLIPLGVIFIMLGWYGAAHARVVQQQIPYMVSGSFLGLGCMVIGGLLFWGHWLYRMYDQADLQHEEQTRLLEGILAALDGRGPAAASGSGVGAAAGRRESGGGATSSQPSLLGSSAYYATSTGTVYHRADCAVIAHHPDDLRVLGPDAVGGMRSCQICTPDQG